jgi:hypothetical protein
MKCLAFESFCRTFNKEKKHTMLRTIQEIIRSVNPIDPRHIDHPCHDEQWLELARAIGRMEAREEFETRQRERPTHDRH